MRRMASGEDAARMEFTAGDLADRDQLAAGSRHGFRFGDRGIAPAHDNRIAHAQPMRLVVGDAQLRQGRQRFGRIAEEDIQGGQPFIAIFNGFERHEFREWNHRLLGKRGDEGSAKRGDVSKAAEIAAEITGERADIGALAAFHFEMRLIGFAVQQCQAVNLDFA